MKHLKLFEEVNIEHEEFPYGSGHDISPREKRILLNLVGPYLEYYRIIVDDHYYYIEDDYQHLNRFDNFNELKDYILSKYYIERNCSEEYLELLKTTKLDPSFDNNAPIRWASREGHIEIVKLLLKDPRVHPCIEDNLTIWWASRNGHKSVVKLLLKDTRVRSKLTEEEINKYTNETS